MDKNFEYKNLGVLVVKSCVWSFSSNVLMRTEKRVGNRQEWLSPNFDRRNVNSLIYIKIWHQACLPSWLYGTELFTLTPTLLAKLECCQQWFLTNVYYVPKFALKQLLLKLSGLKSIESEIALRRLLGLGCLLSGDKITVFSKLFKVRAILISILCEKISSFWY